MYENNVERINRRINAGLDRLRKDYEVNELSVGDLKRFTVAGRVHVVSQYEIVGIGNLLVMTNTENNKNNLRLGIAHYAA